MPFSIEEDVFALYPGLRVVTVAAHGLGNRGDDERVAKRWEEAWRQAGGLAERYPNAQSHPHVAAWRTSMKRAGVPVREYPSSIEAMLRRAMKGAAPVRINPLVDLLHSVAMEWLVPTGGFDLRTTTDAGPSGDAAAGASVPVELRLSRTGDTFQALDEATSVPVPPGEVSYAAGSTILTRHFVWRQAKQGLIGPESREVLLVAEILPEVATHTPGIAEAVAGELTSRLDEVFGVSAATAVLDAADRSFVWQS